MELSVQERLKKLREPFSTSDLEWRVGRMNQDKTMGRALPYLTFRAVADRLDEVMGPENWKPEYVSGPAGGVVCRLSLRVNGEWIVKENGADNTDVEGVKGGLTDALKRACAMWGIGRYLYAYEAPAVELDEHRRLKYIPTLPDEMLPEAERQGDKAPTPAPAAPEDSAPAVEQPKVENKPRVAPKPETKAEDAPAPVEQAAVAAEPEAPVATPAPAAAPAAAPAQVTETGEGSFLDPIPAGLSEADENKVREILARAQKDVSINVLKNYVNGKGKDTMSAAARQYLMIQLDKFTS